MNQTMNFLNRQSPIPLYHQLKEYLIEHVENGDFPTDEPLPTEMEIIKQFTVSRATVRRAMQELELDGYIHRMPGKGTFILRTKLKRGLSRLNSFSEDMAERGQAVTSKLLDFDECQPPAHVAEKLGISAKDLVLYVYRLRLADDIPMALNISYLYLPEGVSIERSELEMTASLWSILEKKNIHLIEADKSIEAIAANEERARLLAMPVGAPLLLVEGIVYTTGHVPVEYHQVISSGERYKYSLHLDR
jgi:GntR family transcriptional regulator